MPLDILIVDDEALARRRLRTLLSDCGPLAPQRLDEADSATQALELLRSQRYDLALLDIQMPGSDGLTLASVLRSLAMPPAVVFVTAHASHALEAFEVDAVDYLTKPVPRERLVQALQKVERLVQARAEAQAKAQQPGEETADTLVIQVRGRVERVPIGDILFIKAELKYLTVRTAQRSYIFDGSLQELEERHAPLFLRVHRNALVARHAIRSLERNYDAIEGESWAVRLHGVPELVGVSRRQVVAVRDNLVR